MKKIIIHLLLLITLVLLPANLVHAEPTAGGNADEGGGGSGSKHVEGGPYFTRTGYLIYIVDENGNQLTDTKVFYSSSERPPSNAMFYPVTRFGGSSNNYVEYRQANWTPPYPFSDGGTPNGSVTKSFFLKDLYVAHFISEHYGDAMLQETIDNTYFLIIEPFYWCQMYNGSTPTGNWLCATAYGWAHMQEGLGYGEYGSALINRYTNNTFPNCFRLEFPQFNLTPLSGKLTNAEIMSSGNGFISLWLGESKELPEGTEEMDEGRKLYAIKNWSDEYDISEGIPSGEMVNNAYEADSFFSNATVETVFSDTERYGATYTYKMEVERHEDIVDEETGEIIETKTWTEWETVATHKFSFSAKASYQQLAEVQAYALDNLKVVNDAFAKSLLYDKSNSSVWYDVSTEITRYLGDGGYDNSGLLGCIDSEDHHYFLPVLLEFP